MNDEVLLDDRGVLITRTKAKIGGTTYPINGVTSVSLKTISPSPVPMLLFGGMGAMALLCGGVTALTGLGQPDYALVAGGVVAVVVGLGLFVLAVFATGGSSWAVLLGTAGGDRSALTTRDREWALQVVQAVEDAVSRRG